MGFKNSSVKDVGCVCVYPSLFGFVNTKDYLYSIDRLSSLFHGSFTMAHLG